MFKVLFAIAMIFFFCGLIANNTIMCGICFGLMFLFAILDIAKGKILEYIIRR